MSTNEITAKARKIKRLQAKIDELNAEIKAAQDEIKAEMTAQNVTEMKAGGYKIRWVDVVSNRFDSTRFKKDHATMYGKYINQSTSKRFSIA